MAVGLGKTLGFDFPENFDYPYSAHAYREQSGIFLMEHLAPEQAEEASGEEYIR
jgi:hypothetical protein